MNNNRNAMYAVAALGGVVIAVLAGVPAYYLILLACPVMMFFMMSSMSGGNTRNDVDAPDARASTKATTPDGSHDRL